MLSVVIIVLLYLVFDCCGRRGLFRLLDYCDCCCCRAKDLIVVVACCVHRVSSI